jgi:arsenate reductase
MGTVADRPGTQPEVPLRADKQARVRIAYVCLGNSCRSQMAEAWTRHLSAGPVEAVSAGVEPLGFIARETFQVMAEKQISLVGQRSKALGAIDWKLVDILVNMSYRPTASLVPEFEGRRLEWDVPDPYGDDLSTYREVRDQLEEQVAKLLSDLKGIPGPAAPPVA